eukprot:Pgem_evm3s3802
MLDTLKNPTPYRVYALVEAMNNGYDVDTLHDITKIDKWFLHKCMNIINCESDLSNQTINSINKELVQQAKQFGFSDLQISKAISSDEMSVRKLRKDMSITPVVKQIDTLAGEFPAATNYLYTTYNAAFCDKEVVNENNGIPIMVLGSGVYRIGSSVEFDW